MIAFALLLLFFVVDVVFNSSFFYLLNCLTNFLAFLFFHSCLTERGEQVALWSLASGWC